jgi:TatD DNase family protein
MKYINIHTHTLAEAQNELHIFNHIVGKDTTFSKYFSAGIHPWHVDEKNLDGQLSKLRELVSQANCVAVGECGIDKVQGPDIPTQEKVFREHIKLAIEFNKPLVIHCVKGFQELLKCIKAEKFEGNFIMHGFNSPIEIAFPFLKMTNCYFSFGRALIQDGSNAEILIKMLPLDRLFLETDAKEINIKNIYDAAIVINSISELVITEQIISNYKKVFVNGLN